MIHDDFNFNFDASDFPVSIEEFAAYMDGNLSDDEMQRVSSVIEHDDMMQDVMDSMEQSELTLSEYTPDDLQLPEEITGGGFEMPEIAESPAFIDPDFYINPMTHVAACAAMPLSLSSIGDFLHLNNEVEEVEGNDDVEVDSPFHYTDEDVSHDFLHEENNFDNDITDTDITDTDITDSINDF